MHSANVKFNKIVRRQKTLYRIFRDIIRDFFSEASYLWTKMKNRISDFLQKCATDNH